MSSNDIKNALKESGLMIPVGGVPLNGDAEPEPIAKCRLFECKFSCATNCWGLCNTQCMLGCAPGCIGLGVF